MLGKKGTEKPIEIFVALFIILAVAMVMLRLFTGQIEEQKIQMTDMQDEARATQELADARTTCASACSRFQQSKNRQDLAAWCLRKLPDLDLNGNGRRNDWNADLLGGLLVCESGVFCPHLGGCQGFQLDDCPGILIEHWNRLGLNGNNMDTMLQSFNVSSGCGFANDVDETLYKDYPKWVETRNFHFTNQSFCQHADNQALSYC